MSLARLDIAFSILTLAFGVWILSHALHYGISSEIGPGSGTFPMIAGLFVTLFSAATLVRAVRERKAASDSAQDRVGLAEIAKIAGILVMIALYVGLFQSLGAFLPLPLLMIGISLVIEWRTDFGWLVKLAVISVAFTVACYFIFADFLRVLLPVGPLGF